MKVNRIKTILDKRHENVNGELSVLALNHLRREFKVGGVSHEVFKRTFSYDLWVPTKQQDVVQYNSVNGLTNLFGTVIGNSISIWNILSEGNF